MAHQIFSSRFFNNSRQPAWHGLGINEEIGITALQALAKVGTYDVTLQPIKVVHPTDPNQFLDSDYRSIVRHPVADDPIHRVFGHPVTGAYHLISPTRSAQLFDEGVGNLASLLPYPVQTLGVLGKGEELFMTCKLEGWNIKGDEMQNYLFAHFPMYNGKAATVGITTIRIVCANTLAAALSQGTKQFIITHRAGCEVIIRDNISTIVAEAEDYQSVLKEAMTVMAEAKLNDEQAKQSLEYVYRTPPMPQADWVGKFGHNKKLDDYMQSYEEKLEVVQRTREVVYGLYAGETFSSAGKKSKQTASTISSTESTNGTGFGLYNAIAEFETYRKGSSAQTTTLNLLVGDRASTIRKGYEAMMHFAKTGNPLQAPSFSDN